MTSIIAVSVAAVAGAPHCLGMCGALACSASSKGGIVPYHLGRVLMYALLGAIAGGVGDVIPGPSWLATALSAVLLIGFSAALAGFVPEPHIRIPGLAKAGAALAQRRGPLARFGFGVVNGLLPCGLLYATLALPVASGSALSGAALMAWFGVLTAIPLTAAAFGLRPFLQKRRVRLVLAGSVLVLGLVNLAGRGAIATAVEQGETPSCH